MTDQPELLWQPTVEQIRNSRISEFVEQLVTEDPDLSSQLADYESFYQWSVDSSADFWSALWRYCGVVNSEPCQEVLQNPEAMPGAKWFVGAKLNYAENCLRYRDDQIAIVDRREDGTTNEISYRALYQQVAQCQDLLISLGVKQGDRVAAYLPNCAQTIIAFLATASMGAIWSSCSPDFGVKGVFERFDQIKPKVLFAVDRYQFGGKVINTLDSARAVTAQIPSIDTLVVFPYLDDKLETEETIDQDSSSAAVLRFDRFVSHKETVEFAQLPFDTPLYILFSSGTTGKPKCIVHGAGGSLLQHLKEHQLHTDIRRHDRLFYFTTCGWMMWNWLVTGLASGCTIITYDGSPFFPKRRSLWYLLDELKVSVFGTSARYIAASRKARIYPKNLEDCDLSALRGILSTGSPLAAESFDYVYERVKSDVMLSSISGGTDIVSCFVLGCPVRPVYRGEIQSRGLGMAVDVFVEGESKIGERGELVCTRPFPSMPIGFWGEKDDTRYHEAYFSRFPGVWAQGDYAARTENDGLIIYGRSDAVLNPGGVRIGTAEIYQQVEKLDEVLESLCIGQIWNDDVRVVLFVMLRDGIELDSNLETRIRSVIQENTTRHHVPKRIVSVPDIPRTLSGKIVELAVRSVVHGDEVKNTEALANPGALEYFRDLEALKR